MPRTDPVDAWFPPRGPCLVCAVPGVDQRHRVIEAIADAVKADPGSDEDIAQDYGVPVEAVTACAQWARDHPDGHERALDHGFLGPA